jgi:hypothetical protein
MPRRLSLVFAVPLLVLLGCQPGDDTVSCGFDSDRGTNCRIVSLRPSSQAIVRVSVNAQTQCFVDAKPVGCEEVGKAARAAHPLDDPKVELCLDRNLNYRIPNSILRQLSDESFRRQEFKCPNGASSQSGERVT